MTAFASEKNYIEYEYEMVKQKIFLLDKINDHKFKDNQTQEINSFIEKNFYLIQLYLLNN